MTSLEVCSPRPSFHPPSLSLSLCSPPPSILLPCLAPSDCSSSFISPPLCQDFGTLALKQLKQAGVRPHQLQSHSAACGLPLCQGETSDKSHAVPDTALGSVALPPTKSKFAAPLPVLGVLKLTPEKGCSVVLALAQVLLGRFDFLVVAGDPKVKQIFGEQPNVQVSYASWG